MGIACCITLSTTVGIPSFLLLPVLLWVFLPFYWIWTVFPVQNDCFTSSSPLSLRYCRSSSTSIPSTPCPLFVFTLLIRLVQIVSVKIFLVILPSTVCVGVVVFSYPCRKLHSRISFVFRTILLRVAFHLARLSAFFCPVLVTFIDYHLLRFSPSSMSSTTLRTMASADFS